MVYANDYVACPLYDSKAHVVYVNQDGKRGFIKCLKRHIHGSRSVKGLCFLVDYSEAKMVIPDWKHMFSVSKGVIEAR